MTGAAWESLLVEIARFGPDTGIIQQDERYLVTCGNQPRRKYEMPLTTEQYLEWVDDLRDAIEQPDSQPIEAQEEILQTVSGMLDLPPPDRPCQIDLVVNHHEIAALPFEAASAHDGRPLLVGRDPPAVLTRRVRGDFRERTPTWPAKPHVLLVASSPEREIPLEDHKRAMRAALRPWIEPLEGYAEAIPHEETLWEKLEQASLGAIKEACRTADPPFTHVHVLAHGLQIDTGFKQRFGLELAADDGSGAVAVRGEDLAEALCGGEAPPTVVTVTACDSANVGSPVVSGMNAAHALHVEGVPVVVASQFPMTFSGSALTVEAFYGRLLAGDDVRDALLATRRLLHDREAETGADWMSLVAYAQLPEGYQDRLLDVRLAADLASLRTAQRWADHLVEYGAPAAKYEQVVARIRERIASLENWEKQSSTVGRKDLIEESRGLLGSAHKRLAELLFRQAALEEAPEQRLEESRAALAESARWYGKAFTDNPSAHWVAVQELSLEAVSHGKILEPWRWHASLAATRSTPRNREDEMWQHGSRAELYLLAPYAGQPRQIEEAEGALERFTELVSPADAYAIPSTSRQLRRYVDWWTNDNGFFPDTRDAAEDAGRLLERSLSS